MALTTAMRIGELLIRDQFPPVVIDGIERLYIPQNRMNARIRAFLNNTGQHYTNDLAVYDAWKAALAADVAAAKAMWVEIQAGRQPASRLEEVIAVPNEAKPPGDTEERP